MKFPKLNKYQKTMVWASCMWSVSMVSMVLSLFRVRYMDSSQPILFWVGAAIGVAACFLYIDDRYEDTPLYKVTDKLGFYFIWVSIFCAVIGFISAMNGLECGKDYSEYRYSTSKKTWSDR